MTSKRRIIVCGAGIAGISAAYHLAVVHGADDVTIIEADNPLSMTSDKSTEAYRNWWPGPDAAMTAFMNRSIDLMEGIARAGGNRINMNRRGYLFASADAKKTDWLIEMARTAEKHGGGPVRVHDGALTTYDPEPDATFDAPLDGADIITDRATIARHFPYLAPGTCLVAHARRAGWLSAQQLGMTMLEGARAAGVKLVRGRVADVVREGGRVASVVIET
ncbi:MAG TPA: FAD-dependent oxidoreductase, partial [Hyphomicrobiaceae bacterium]|nr:FAD-dependent oxidoreductase [Hyphomicrobiaceae bacterium]